MILLAIGAFAAVTAAALPDPTYTALRAARPDGRTIAVKDFAFDRDAYHITLAMRGRKTSRWSSRST